MKNSYIIDLNDYWGQEWSSSQVKKLLDEKIFYFPYKFLEDNYNNEQAKNNKNYKYLAKDLIELIKEYDIIILKIDNLYIYLTDYFISEHGSCFNFISTHSSFCALSKSKYSADFLKEHLKCYPFCLSINYALDINKTYIIWQKLNQEPEIY